MSKNPHAKRRRIARLSAVQGLYQMELSGSGVQATITEFLEHRFQDGKETKNSKIDPAYFTDILEGVVREQDIIDSHLKTVLNANWSLSRLDKTLLAIMRAAAYEIYFRPDVPALVIIDEYVTLTADFYDNKERAFVNASLQNLAKNHRKAEFGLSGLTP